MKIHVPDGYPVTCSNCSKTSYSVQSDLIWAGLIDRIGSEVCENCGWDITLPKMQPTIYGPAIPQGATYTPRESAPRKVVKEIRFCVADEKGYAVSCIWKLWVQTNNVYMMSTGSQHWKLYIHETGQNNIALIPDYFHLYGAHFPDRYIVRCTRARPYLAHFNRIMCLHITGHQSGHPFTNIRRLKKRQTRSLRRIRAVFDPLKIQILYTKGHPDLYNETYIPDPHLIAILKASRDDCISVVITNETDFDINEDPRIRLELNRENGAGFLISEKFGLVLNGTFYVEQSLSALGNITYIT